jgi:hypothetical protein
VANDEPGPGGELVSALWARRAIQPISLSPLDPAQSEIMLRECLTATSPLPDLLDAVVTRSDGVPFFIEELLAASLGGANPGRAVCGNSARVEGGPASNSSASANCFVHADGGRAVTVRDVRGGHEATAVPVDAPVPGETATYFVPVIRRTPERRRRQIDWKDSLQ